MRANLSAKIGECADLFSCKLNIVSLSIAAELSDGISSRSVCDGGEQFNLIRTIRRLVHDDSPIPCDHLLELVFENIVVVELPQFRRSEQSQDDFDVSEEVSTRYFFFFWFCWPLPLKFVSLVLALIPHIAGSLPFDWFCLSLKIADIFIFTPNTSNRSHKTRCQPPRYSTPTMSSRVSFTPCFSISPRPRVSKESSLAI